MIDSALQAIHVLGGCYACFAEKGSAKRSAPPLTSQLTETPKCGEYLCLALNPNSALALHTRQSCFLVLFCRDNPPQ